MKRYVEMFFIIMIILGLSGCQDKEYLSDASVPSETYDSDIYCTTGEQQPDEAGEDAISLSQFPEDNGKSDFDALDSPVPSVMYNGNIYRTTGKQMAGEVDEAAFVGKITSIVSSTQWPKEDGQANFDELNSPYAITSDGFVVLFDNEWTFFEIMDTDN